MDTITKTNLTTAYAMLARALDAVTFQDDEAGAISAMLSAQRALNLAVTQSEGAQQ